MRFATASISSLVLLLSTACSLDSLGLGTDTGTPAVPTDDGSSGTSGSESGATQVGTGADTTAAATDDDGSTTDPGCTPGTVGCGCDDGACNQGLMCMDGVCMAPSCGDGNLDRGEVCDDGNVVDGDGCQSDCTPTPGTTVVAGVSVGREHTCAWMYEGEVVCWGRGGNGRLGYGINTGDVGDGELANAVGYVDTGGVVVQLALGNEFTCARFADATARCWGVGGEGRLGQGFNTGDLGNDEPPTQLDPIALGGDVVDIAAGHDHACAVRDTGEVYCWGQGAEGRLGYGDTNIVGQTDTPEQRGPVSVGGSATRVVAGETHTCALVDGGGVRCWGHNDVGQLGLGHYTTIGDDEPPNGPPNVHVGGTVVDLAAGRDHTCALRDDGVMRCWGANGAGQLGYGHTNNVNDPADMDIAGDLILGADVIAMALGEAHTCVVLMGGSVKCWGSGGEGRLGTMDTADRSMPPAGPIDTGPIVIQRLSSQRNHTCAYRVDNEVLCWGAGNRGQLGYGNADDVGDDETPASVGTVMIIPP